MRVVALVPGGVEQQLLFFPTLDDLKQNYPNAEIDVVVEPSAKAAYRVSRSVNDVLTFDFQDRNSPADWANLLGILRDRDYEAVLSSGGAGIGLLLWLTGIPTRVGFRNGGSLFLTNPVPQKTEQYVAHAYHDLLQGFGISGPCPNLALRIPKVDQDWAQAERKRLGLDGYVLVDGNSDYPIKSWQQIVQDLQQKQPEIPILIIQSEENREFVAALSQQNPGLKLSNPKDLGKLAALIAGANLMLCTEGVPMHLAVALEVYTLVLFAGADPAKLLPNQEKFLGIKSPTNRLADIPPEQVLQKVWGG
jgi:ADP-heptose:LPS heptosyltransferase